MVKSFLKVIKLKDGKIILTIFFIMSSFFGCGTDKYPMGRDTVKSFGNGRYQILYIGKDKCLMNVETQSTIVLQVAKFRTRGTKLFVTGKDGKFTILDYKNDEYKIYDDTNSLPEEYKYIFKK